MVYVADRADVTMRLITFKLLFCHIVASIVFGASCTLIGGPLAEPVEMPIHPSTRFWRRNAHKAKNQPII
jgi:hypothetical protein